MYYKEILVTLVVVVPVNDIVIMAELVQHNTIMISTASSDQHHNQIHLRLQIVVRVPEVNPEKKFFLYLLP